MDWTTVTPTEPGWYHARYLSDGRDDGIYEIRRATTNNGRTPILVACWLGKWHDVRGFHRQWLGPFANVQQASDGAKQTDPLW